MRVSSGQLSQLVLQGLHRQDRHFANLMVQMSSGYRINRMSDDPLGTVTLLSVRRDQSSFEQYQDNISRVISQMEQSESFLDASFNVLLRVQDLALAAVNGSATTGDLSAVASELENLRASLVQFGNARDQDGNYLFSGSRLDTPPIDGVAYQGDDLRREVPVADGMTLAGNETIESVYFNGGNFFADLDTFIADLQAGGGDRATTGPAMLQAVERAINGVSEKMAQIGVRINRANSLDTAQQDLALANEKIRAKIQDLDYVEAASRVSEIELALTTTQKTYSRLSQLTLFSYL